MLLVRGTCLFNQCNMATMNEKLVEVDAREDGEDDTHPEKISSFDGDEEASESKTRVHRFDMVLKHLHRLKSQMNNNNSNGAHSPPIQSSENIPNSSAQVQPQMKNKIGEESLKDGDDGFSTNIEANDVEDTMVEERKLSPSLEQNLQKSTVPLASPIPPAFKELHKLQALKLLQQQSQQRGHYQGKERERKQLPHQRFPQHFGGPLSHHPSHRHSPPLPLKLPPPMRHPFFNHHHPQPINQPNNHYYSNSNSTVRNFPQPGYFSPPLSQRLSGQNSGPTSPAFPTVHHQGNSNPNYPIPPPPLTRFPMPPGLMRALAPNLANIAPHMIQPLLDEAKHRLAAMQARMGSEGPQPPPMFPPSNSISESPSSPPDPPHQGNKLSSLFPPMMKDIPMDWNNPMLSSTAGFKSPNSSDVPNLPLEGCSSSFYRNKDHRNKNEVSLNGRKDKDMRGQISLTNEFQGMEGPFLPSSEDGRLDFTGDDDEEDEIFLEEDVGVDDDDEEEELDGLGINVNILNGMESEISKETNTRDQDFSQYERKMASHDKITDRLSKEKRQSGGNDSENNAPRKRKRTTSNEMDEVVSPSDDDLDTTCKENKKFSKRDSNKDCVSQREDEILGENLSKNENKSKRMRSGSVSPTPSTGGISPPPQGSPGTPPLPPDGRMFPPPFAYKLLEVRKIQFIPWLRKDLLLSLIFLGI